MNRPSVWLWIAALILVLLAASLFLGIDRVPFHPDESSWLVQSADFERFLAGPGSLGFVHGAPITADMSYRLLNAPMAKYVLALGRRAVGYPAEALPTDWNWSASWEANQSQGAVPADGLLHSARQASAALVALSLLPLFLAGRRLGGTATGVLAALLFAANALVLLHGRRAMAEGALMLAVNLLIVGVLWGDRYPWLTGLCLGLALAAKQSTLPLIPVGLLGVAWSPAHPRQVDRRLAVCCVVLVGMWAILNPVVWRQPIPTLVAMAGERSRLVGEQVADFHDSSGTQVLDTPAKRAATILAAVFMSPPQLREAANYDEALGEAQRAYLANPLTHLGRGPIAGATMLLLTLLGIALGIRRASAEAQEIRRDMTLLLLLTLAQVGGLLIAVPLAFQRYYLPLIPMVCLWIALALATGLNAIRRQRTSEPRPVTV